MAAIFNFVQLFEGQILIYMANDIDPCVNTHRNNINTIQFCKENQTLMHKTE